MKACLRRIAIPPIGPTTTHDDYLTAIGQKSKIAQGRGLRTSVQCSAKPSLLNQRAVLKQFHIDSGKTVAKCMKGSVCGLNFKSKNFLPLISQMKQFRVFKIVIAHKNRLVRFGLG